MRVDCECDPEVDELDIGVLSDPAYIRSLQGEKALNSAENMLLAGSKNNARLIFFSYNELDVKKMSVTGYCRSGDRWERVSVALPAVIYDQAHSCPVSLRTKLMKAPDLYFVNEKIGFWKWETHTALIEYPEVAGYLPESYEYTHEEQAAEILKKYGKVVLKPVYGYRAKGLIVLTQDHEGIRYQYRGTGSGRQGGYFYGSIKAIDNLRRQFPVMKKEPYIVQQGIQLARFKDRVFDVRALTQKDGNAQWDAVLCAKVGPEKSQITAIGGWSTMEQIEDFLVRKHGKKFASLTERIRALSILLSETVDKAFAPNGELGLDIGVDNEANLWLIEVNSMPGKTMYYSLFDKELLSQLYTRPIDYACYLHREFGTKS